MAGIASHKGLHEVATQGRPERPCEGVGLRIPRLPDQVVVDDCVEVAVVHSIVHMAILVIVLPPCLDGQEVPVGLVVTMTTLHSLVL